MGHRSGVWMCGGKGHRVPQTPVSAPVQELPKLFDLKLHECWKVKGMKKKAPAGQSRRMSVEFAAPVPTAPAGSTNEGNVELSHSFTARFILHPGGLFRTVWNLVVALCVLHDVVMIPLSAFEISETTFLSVFQWMVLISWNIDLLISLVTGFYNDGTLIMVPWQIWVNYAKTWMLFDISFLEANLRCLVNMSHQFVLGRLLGFGRLRFDQFRLDLGGYWRLRIQFPKHQWVADASFITNLETHTDAENDQTEALFGRRVACSKWCSKNLFFANLFQFSSGPISQSRAMVFEVGCASQVVQERAMAPVLMTKSIPGQESTRGFSRDAALTSVESLFWSL